VTCTLTAKVKPLQFKLAEHLIVVLRTATRALAITETDDDSAFSSPVLAEFTKENPSAALDMRVLLAPTSSQCRAGVCQATRAVAATSANGEENEEKGQENEGGLQVNPLRYVLQTTHSDYAHCSIRHSTCGFPHSSHDRQEVAE